MIIINILLGLIVFVLHKKSSLTDHFVNYLIFPLFLVNCTVAYIVLVNQAWLIHLLFIFSSILIYLYIKYIFLIFLKPSLYTPLSLENLSVYGNFLVTFLLFSSIFGWQAFLDMAVWKSSIIVLFAIGFINYEIFWFHKININKFLIYIFVSSLLLVELVWVVSFLPFNFNILGFILAVFAYVIIGLAKLHLLDKLDKKSIKLHLGIAFVSIFVILLTTQWI